MALFKTEKTKAKWAEGQIKVDAAKAAIGVLPSVSESWSDLKATVTEGHRQVHQENKERMAEARIADRTRNQARRERRADRKACKV